MSDPRPAPPPKLRPAVRALISVLLILHMTAAFTAPWQLATDSELSRLFARPARYYLDATFLDHGYNFFSPDPGFRSSMVAYELEMPDGTMPKGVFPDIDQHWPRLWYHRHFMLSEYMGRFYMPAEVVEQADERYRDEARREYEANKSRLEAIARGYARHLMAASGAKRAFIYVRQHTIPTLPEVKAGRTLSDPESFEDFHVGTWTKDET